MKHALLFSENTDSILVSADDIKNGLYSRHEEFVDPEYEFKVQYVKGSKNNGGPYFRLYYSYEEYKKLFPERATRYEIVANMRRFYESQWHKQWKERVSDFCAVEKYIKNTNTNKWKFADAYIEKSKVCIEFQHSYIALDFEERNKFYAELGIKTIWLYDLSNANTNLNVDANVEILEDNSKGFFRISENPDNLKNNRVYIQVKSGAIYRVKELLRLDSSTEHKSTIRYFVPSEVYTEEEFIEYIKLVARIKDDCPKTIGELWQKNYKWMTVEDVLSGERIYINRGLNGDMYRDLSNGCILYFYTDRRIGCGNFSQQKRYWLNHQKEKENRWLLVNVG